MALPPAIGGGGGGNVNIGIVITLNTQNVIQQFNRLQQSINNTQNRLRGLDTQFRGFDSILKFLAAGALAAAGAGFVKLSAEMERLQIQMGIFEGGAQAAGQRLDQVVKLASTAPFKIQTLADSFVKLRAAGLEPITGKNGEGPLKDLIDGVAAFGGSDEVFKRATIAIQQMAGKGVISMEELRQQLGEAIPNAIQLMAEGLGISVSKLITEVSRGNVEFEQGIEAFLTKLREKFAGASELLSGTFLGSLNKLRSEFSKLAIEFERQGGLSVLTGSINVLTQAFSNLNEQIKSGGLIQQGVDAFFKIINDNADTIASVINTLSNFARIIYDIGGAIVAVLSVLPAEALAGGLIGFIFFGPAGAVGGAILGTFSEQIASITSLISEFIQNVISILASFGIDINKGGLLGRIIIGDGSIFSLFEAAVRYVLGSIAVVARTIMEIVADFIGAIANIKVQFDQGIMEGIFNNSEVRRKGAEAGAAARDAFLEAYAGKSIAPSAKASPGKIVGDDVTKATDQVKRQIQNMKNVRKMFDEAGFGSPNPPAGLSPRDINIQTKFASMQNALESRLEGARAGGSDVLSYVASQRQKLEGVTGVIERLRDRIHKLNEEGKPEQAAQLTAEMNELTGQVGKFRGGLNELVKLEMDKILLKIGDGARELGARLDDIHADATLDPVEQGVANVNKQFAGMQTTLSKLREETKKLNGNSQEYAETVDMLTKLEERMNVVREEAIAKATQLAQRQKDAAKLSMNRSVVDFDFEARSLEAANNFDKLTSALDDVAQKYTNLFRSLDDQIRNINQQMEDGLVSKSDAADAIAALEAIRQRIIDTQETSLLRARYEASTIGQLFKSVGETIEDSIGQALESIITRTGSLKDILTQFYNEITRAAIRYLIEQAKIGVFGQAAAGGGGAGFGLFSLLFGGSTAGAGAAAGGGAAVAAAGGGGMPIAPLMLAKGGAFSGMIKPFASGDIIRGPTMFGLAGEAGDEAIMPLTRSKTGHLGVRSVGHGGDSFNISIQALDSRSVRELFLSEGSSLVSSIQRRNRFNRGFRT